VKSTRYTTNIVFIILAAFSIHAQEKARDPRLRGLLRAASGNEVGAAQKLLNEGLNVNAADKYGETALMFGAHHPEMVATLLKAGANVNAQSKRGMTALIYSMLDYRDGARLLIAAGADVNAKTKHGLTALMMAAYDGRVDKINMLIQAGADVNAKDKHHKSALTYAMENKQSEAIEALKTARVTP